MFFGFREPSEGNAPHHVLSAPGEMVEAVTFGGGVTVAQPFGATEDAGTQVEVEGAAPNRGLYSCRSPNHLSRHGSLLDLDSR